MKTISRLRLDIQPFYFAKNNNELRIRLNVNGDEVNFSQVLLDDDMASRFDVIFDAAKEALRQAILRGGQ